MVGGGIMWSDNLRMNLSGNGSNKFFILGGNMHKIPKYGGYFVWTKWFLKRLGPHSSLPHL